MSSKTSSKITIREIQKKDFPITDTVFRLAFGTFLRIPEPNTFYGDAAMVASRSLANPNSVYVAEDNGKVIGSSFITRWGSVAFIGPLTVHPKYWNKGVGKLLLEKTMQLLNSWDVSLVGLFTFPHSEKHMYLYGKYGFSKQKLTPLLSKDVREVKKEINSTIFSNASLKEQNNILKKCFALTDNIYSGFDLKHEITETTKQKLGETLLLWEKEELIGFAICQFGKGTEGGSNMLYIKCGVIKPSKNAGNNFELLLDMTEDFSQKNKLTTISLGINKANTDELERTLRKGFHVNFEGVIMHLNNNPGLRNSKNYIIDDWR